MALAWWAVNYTLVDEKLHIFQNVFIVQYEQFVHNPEQMLCQIYNVINLRYNKSLTKYVHQNSVGKGKNIVLDKAVNKICHDLHNNIIELSEAVSLG